MREVKNVDDLYDHIGFVVLCAPDNFPVRDYLPLEEQMNLQKAFEQLEIGVSIAYPEYELEQKRRHLSSLLDASLQAYRAGDRVKGAHILQNFQGEIFRKS